MDAHAVLDRYYELANAGDWDAWCDLFDPEMVMDEQLAGHIEGLEKLRSMMAGMGEMYSTFENRPIHTLVDGDQAAVVSHISARGPAGQPVEAEVMNYFRIERGLITYLANFHDTKPFAVLGE
jgi:ketosteroid isomerase-like protein